METKNPVPTPPQPNDLVYTVMPQEMQHLPAETKRTMSASPSPGNAAMPAKGSKKFLTFIILLLILLGLGGAAWYYLFVMEKGPDFGNKSSAQSESKLPKVWMFQYFQTEACTEDGKCGDAADPDNDGLTNYDEFKSNTNPTVPDTDLDGLADGDELYIFKTEPTLKYTDKRELVSQNDWYDGFQMMNSYDPLTPGIKFTESRIAQIKADIAKFTLHEPSVTTLKVLNLQSLDTPSGPKTTTIYLSSGQKIPGLLTLNQGDSVTWVNNDDISHQILSDWPGFGSEDLAQSESYTYKFIEIGTFEYSDSVDLNTKGTITVR